MSTTSNFADLYKSSNKFGREIRQSERRSKLLKEQKQQRNKLLDKRREIDNFVKKFERECPKQHAENPYKDQLQLSEWLIEKPVDIHNWYLVPCPKGKRCLVVAENGRTRAFSKYGVFIREFRSKLPGDFRQRNSTTILDCVFIQDTEDYFVLDVIVYANQDMTQCEAEFRFFWIRNKIEEEDLSNIGECNEASLKSISTFNCSDHFEVEKCLQKYPMWDNNSPVLDGLLFYHKESSYVHGTTPLVGWILPFMLQEVMQYSAFNPMYLVDKPTDYTDYLSYIKKFDDNEITRKKKNKRKSHRPNHKMDIEQEEDPDSVDVIIETQQKLELSNIAMEHTELML